MASARYIVTYDTPSDARRARLHRLLSGFGVRVQWSVFECVLADGELRRLRRLIDRTAEPDLDSVFVFRCAAAGSPTHPWLARHEDRDMSYWLS
jgi:CRISPR-associated endonuclease Cas2